jgi:hypothetical protein
MKIISVYSENHMINSICGPVQFLNVEARGINSDCCAL